MDSNFSLSAFLVGVLGKHGRLLAQKLPAAPLIMSRLCLPLPVMSHLSGFRKKAGLKGSNDINNQPARRQLLATRNADSFMFAADKDGLKGGPATCPKPVNNALRPRGILRAQTMATTVAGTDLPAAST